MTSPPIISPAAEGTKEMLPTFLDFSLPPSSFTGFIGSSFEYTTFSFFIPLALSSRLITFAKGQTEVLFISLTSSIVGFILFPVPIDEITGIFFSAAVSIRLSFEDTRSIASTI